MSSDKIIKLKSNDDEVFEISEKAVKRSRLVDGILQDYEDNTEVPLPDVSGKILKKIIEYLKYYENSEPKSIPKPLKNSQIEDILEEWDYEYIISVELEDSIDLLNATLFDKSVIDNIFKDIIININVTIKYIILLFFIILQLL